jgi:hypothetical protein
MYFNTFILKYRKIYAHKNKRITSKPLIKALIVCFSGTIDYKFPIEMDDLDILDAVTVQPSRFGCQDPQQFLSLMTENGLSMPDNKEQAQNLFLYLIQSLDGAMALERT